MQATRFSSESHQVFVRTNGVGKGLFVPENPQHKSVGATFIEATPTDLWFF